MWLRGLLKQLADQGRSVLVSSHLLAEMALMADALVVVGRGRLIASGPVDDFVRGSAGNAVIASSPDADRLAGLLTQRGATVSRMGDGKLTVTGLLPDQVGDAAFDAGVRLHELSVKTATLEEAFLEATEHSEEFVAQRIERAE